MPVFYQSQIAAQSLRVVCQFTYGISLLDLQPSNSSPSQLSFVRSYFLHTLIHLLLFFFFFTLFRHGRKRRHAPHNSSAAAKATLSLGCNRVRGRTLQPHPRKSTPPGLCGRRLPRTNHSPRLLLDHSTTSAKTTPTTHSRCKSN